MNIRPKMDKVLVLRDLVENKNGILLVADTAKKKPNTGKVVAVGEGHMLTDGRIKELEVKVGDNVVFSRMTGTVIYIDDMEHIILKERDILGIIN